VTPKVIAAPGFNVPQQTFRATGAIEKGDLLILDNAGGDAGEAKKAASDDADFNATNIEGGLLGIAAHGCDDDEAITVDMLSPFSNVLLIETYTTAPTPAILGVAQSTLYTFRNDAGVFKVNLGVTANGIARFLNFDWTYSSPYTNTDTGLTAKTSGYSAGDRVYVVIPESMRHWR
jgi:hypothetical protein